MIKRHKEYFMIFMALIVIGAIYILIHCPIKYITGIACPGCGMTRAYISLLKLDVAKSFYYHPLWPIPIMYLFVYYFFRNKNRKVYNFFVCIVIMLFILVYFYRLFNNNDIVNIRIENGLLYKIFHALFK